MPDFRGALDQAKFKPETTGVSTTGPNAEGEQQTWTNPRPQLTQSSAQQLADLMGAKLVPISYNGGPYSQDKPQWQLDFGTGNLHDAAMVAENYQRSPQFFSQSMQDELTYAQKYPNGVGAGPGGGGDVSQPGGGGGGTGGFGGGLGPPNLPGPTVPTTPLPPPTGVDPVVKEGETTQGGYTVPPKPTGRIPGSLLLNNAVEVKGVEPLPMTPDPMTPLQMPGLLSPNGPYKPKTQTLRPLGLLNPYTNQPLTPEELVEFGKTGRSPRFGDKEPYYPEP